MKNEKESIDSSDKIMRKIRFNDLEQFLKTGREVEFTYNGKNYSITNDSTGHWNFCLDEDTGNVLLGRICSFKELDCLAEKIANTDIDGISLRQVFDELLYDVSHLYVL